MKKNASKFNTFSFCPNCKSDQITSNNGHKYVCGVCKFEYFHNTAAAVAAIVCCADEILFTTRAQDPEKGKLDLPGGFVDHNESLEQALTRELQEELGLNLSNWQYFCSGSNSYHYKGIIYKTCDTIFVTHLAHKPAINKDPSEIADYKWIAKNQINTSDIAFSSLQQALEKYLITSNYV
jgi:NADH pyrophosphatase NudC (nudix superfamily)